RTSTAASTGSRPACQISFSWFPPGRSLVGRTIEQRTALEKVAGRLWSTAIRRISISRQKSAKWGRNTMNRMTAILSIAAAFAAGCGVTHLMQPARAAADLAPQILHVPELLGDALSPANAVGF